jgi:hypothetical protein
MSCNRIGIALDPLHSELSSFQNPDAFELQESSLLEARDSMLIRLSKTNYLYPKKDGRIMPSFPPRVETIKKQGQLSKRELELRQAIQSHASEAELTKRAEKFRAAQLSFLKATLHRIQEKEYQKKPHHYKIGTVEEAITTWTAKTVEEIIQEAKLKVLDVKKDSA